jgi:hypothetical protein
MPVLYPVVANTPLAEDADWLPFRDVYSPLDLSQKRSEFVCCLSFYVFTLLCFFFFSEVCFVAWFSLISGAL